MGYTEKFELVKVINPPVIVDFLLEFEKTPGNWVYLVDELTLQPCVYVIEREAVHAAYELATKWACPVQIVKRTKVWEPFDSSVDWGN